jgi:hypothetical protein
MLVLASVSAAALFHQRNHLEACFYRRCGATVVETTHNDSNSPLSVCGVSITLWKLREYAQQLELIECPRITEIGLAQR